MTYKYSEKFTNENSVANQINSQNQQEPQEEEQLPLVGWDYDEDDKTYSLLKDRKNENKGYIKGRTNVSYLDMNKYNNRRKRVAKSLFAVDGALSGVLLIVIVFIKGENIKKLALFFFGLAINFMFIPPSIRLYYNKLNKKNMQIITSVGSIICLLLFYGFIKK